MEELKTQFKNEKHNIMEDKKLLLEEFSLIQKENFDLRKTTDLQKDYIEYDFNLRILFNNY